MGPRLWWFGNGMLVQASLARDKTYSVNPLTHTVTIQSSDEMPKDGAGAIGYALGLTVARPSCEATAANLIGFGWGVTVLAKDGMPLMSCWSWQ